MPIFTCKNLYLKKSLKSISKKQNCSSNFSFKSSLTAKLLTTSRRITRNWKLRFNKRCYVTFTINAPGYINSTLVNKCHRQFFKWRILECSPSAPSFPVRWFHLPSQQRPRGCLKRGFITWEMLTRNCGIVHSSLPTGKGTLNGTLFCLNTE